MTHSARLLSLLIVAIIAAIGLASCSNDKSDDASAPIAEPEWRSNLIGTWNAIGSGSGETYTYTYDAELNFAPDGTGRFRKEAEYIYQNDTEITYNTDFNFTWEYAKATGKDYAATVALTVTTVNEGSREVGENLILSINKMSRTKVEFGTGNFSGQSDYIKK